MKKNRFWVVVIGVMAMLSVAALIVLQLTKRDGDVVLVKQNGVITYEWPLKYDKELEVPAENGGYNVIVIKNGAVWVSKASCPDQYCVHFAPLSTTVGAIICLPNHLTITVVEKDGTQAVDEVTG